MDTAKQKRFTKREKSSKGDRDEARTVLEATKKRWFEILCPDVDSDAVEEYLALDFNETIEITKKAIPEKSSAGSVDEVIEEVLNSPKKVLEQLEFRRNGLVKNMNL